MQTICRWFWNCRNMRNILCQTLRNGDGYLLAISKFQNHPSMKTVLKKCSFSFSFKTVSLTGKEKEIKSLNINKVFIPSHIPTFKYFKTK